MEVKTECPSALFEVNVLAMMKNNRTAHFMLLIHLHCTIFIDCNSFELQCPHFLNNIQGLSKKNSTFGAIIINKQEVNLSDLIALR